MTFTAFLLIFGSAVTHATWNLLAKKRKMGLAFYAIICTMGALIWGHVQFWTPVKIFSLPPSFWGVIAGTVFFDIFYGVGIILIYKKMEMASAYPVMRSLPIVLTALFTTLLGLGNPLTWTAATGFLIVFTGALLMPLSRFSDFKPSQYWNKTSFLLLMAAMGTTGYTIFDSLGVKLIAKHYPEVSNAVRSMTYYSTRGIALSLFFWLVVLCVKEDREEAKEFFREKDFMPVVAGCFSSTTYILVLLAMNFVSNVSYVQVFRQLGLPVGMFAGVFFLKEKCTLTKIVGVSLILGGLTLSVLKF